jgi:hypothetical protein
MFAMMENVAQVNELCEDILKLKQEDQSVK